MLADDGSQLEHVDEQVRESRVLSLLEFLEDALRMLGVDGIRLGHLAEDDTVGERVVVLLW